MRVSTIKPYEFCDCDVQITYWDSSDCNAIRIMDASTDDIRALCIEPDGKYFVSAGADKLVKLWDYDEGSLKAVGTCVAVAWRGVCVWERRPPLCCPVRFLLRHTCNGGWGRWVVSAQVLATAARCCRCKYRLTSSASFQWARRARSCFGTRRRSCRET